MPSMNNCVSLKKIFLILIIFTLSFSSHSQDKSKPSDLEIWFNHPALSWNEALPVGNGKLGAMVFGGITSERLQLNESSVWVGKPDDFVNPKAKTALPEVRRLLFEGKFAEAQKVAHEKMMGDKKTWSTYQTLGDLTLTVDTAFQEVSGYKRALDLKTAVSTVSFSADDVQYRREIFSSFPDKVLVTRLTADKKGILNFSIELSRPGNKAKITTKGDEIILSEHVGDGNGVKMVTRLKVLTEGGFVTVKDQKIQIRKADAVTILIAAATDYYKEDPNILTSQYISSAVKKRYEDLKKDHIADYQEYFDRVDLELGSSESIHYPTDARLTAMQNGIEDPALLKLYYQFGRYLLISSSRPGGLPANLQGIWADGMTPPWSADYHININIQMNYWLSETTNLSELHEPFLNFIDALRPDGRKTAKDMYGLEGTVAHFTTDPFHFTETYGEPRWAMWPMGMAWSTQHLWEHYLFTEDKEFLKKAYPILKDAALFCVNFLVKDPATGRLVSGPSISPENTFKTKEGEVATMVMGPTMDHMIIRELFRNTIEASNILKTDAAFRKRISNALDQLAPTKIGKDGRIMEWTEEFEENEPGHRHISHLFGLHPGREITKQTNPELLAAARKTIDHRLSNGGGHTGWSRAWIVNFFARLKDGDKAYENLVALLRKSTLPNLFDNHPPFQIDGNFGATAGITEMLLQSHAGELEILPALPAKWDKGFIHGICARGGFEVDIDWENGQLKGVKIVSKLGNNCKIRYKEKVIEIKTEKGKSYQFNGELTAL
jgi:alpha-L-fucosidase 2